MVLNEQLISFYKKKNQKVKYMVKQTDLKMQNTAETLCTYHQMLQPVVNSKIWRLRALSDSFYRDFYS